MKHLLAMLASAILTCGCCAKACADVSYADLFLSGRGYRPVEDAWSIRPSISYPADENNISDNPPYREWCASTFENGEHIYEAYKEIAFGINYRAEPTKTDYWQTPVETRRDRWGDCEDAVFLFFSRLSELDIDGDIVWGWVADRESAVAFAHVWYQLFDKHGKPYIVEGFSKEWNGIIPVEMIAEGERRIPTFVLRHKQVNRAVEEMLPGFDDSLGDAQSPWSIYLNNSTVIREIFQKLQAMFARYRGQLGQSLF